ncbi:helix-turn-helix transcriptional regulator [Actinoplanes sp. NEAU-A12]|uniref:Helix-turn-helix transcriptional regulator n=1 Tax=Actinoplanes sandaracinus TaxID=3045177 RepID=A0ABT6X2B6_9ACTN|nr:helix-turn-helix transcriptional regulator [Actinoplanes sandaracinus]MDI6106069.1 helix-turn-helix transcriptional regulator [Actinoplanes sandaracinus]
MPRPEEPVDESKGSVAEFALSLRDLRRKAGSPNYRELSARTHFSASTLSTAASGRRLPSLDVTLAYVRSCGGDVTEWTQRWQSIARGIDAPGRAAQKPGITSSEMGQKNLIDVSVGVFLEVAKTIIQQVENRYQR